MAERCLLHKNKIEPLKVWLTSSGYELQPTKGIYEVLRATKGKETVVVFRKALAKEHLKDKRLIQQFIRETKGEW